MRARNIGVFSASLAFALTFACYLVVEKLYLADLIRQNAAATYVISFISAVGVYAAVFVLLFWALSYGALWMGYGGRWYHLGRVEGSHNSVRHGECHVSVEYGDCEFTGTNIRPGDDHPTSMWHSLAVARSARRLHITFLSEGVDETHSESEGVMTLVVKHGPLWRRQLEGHWKDVAPHRNQGTITLYRSRSEYEQAVNAAGERVHHKPHDDGPDPPQVHPTALLCDPEGISLGTGTTIAEYVVMKSHAESGGRIAVGESVEFKPKAYITADGSRVQIGDSCGIGHGVWIGGRADITIGRNCLIAMNSVILSSERDLPIEQVPAYLAPQRPGPVTIGDNVFIGAGTMVLPGITIGAGAVVGAGSVVTHNVRPHTTVYGSPAREAPGGAPPDEAHA